MFDKMCFNGSSEVIEESLNTYRQHQLAKLQHDQHYEKVWRIDLDTKRKIVLKACPRNSLGNASPCSIELNPNHWTTWRNILEEIQKFTEPSSLKIDRIDYNVDLQEPYPEVWERLRIRHKIKGKPMREWDEINGERMTGNYFGKGREIILVYDKAHELHRNEFRKISDAEVGVSTRCEVRQRHEKVPIKELSMVEGYLDYDPFEKFESYRLRSDLRPDVFRERKMELENIGMNRLYRRMNREGNFHKTYEKYFIKEPLGAELLEKHRSSLRPFFEIEDSKVVKNSMEAK